MRPVHLTDLDIATRVLLAIGEADRMTAACRIVATARIADRYRNRLRRRHPDWGDGTLAAAATAQVSPVAAQRCDRAYLRSLRLLLDAIDGPASFDFHTHALYVAKASASKDETNGQYPGETAERRPCLGSHR